MYGLRRYFHLSVQLLEALCVELLSLPGQWVAREGLRICGLWMTIYDHALAVLLDAKSWNWPITKRMQESGSDKSTYQRVTAPLLCISSNHITLAAAYLINSGTSLKVVTQTRANGE